MKELDWFITRVLETIRGRESETKVVFKITIRDERHAKLLFDNQTNGWRYFD